MIRKLRLMGDPVLVSEAEPVEEVSPSTKTLVNDMLETMDSAGGVGLAANQVGVLQRVFVYDCPVDDSDPSPDREYKRGAIINPVWEAIGEEMQLGQEGCLSVPDVYADTERYMNVHVTGLDENGEKVDFEATGLLARCIQHETDHLDGVLFIKRLTKERRKEAMREIRNSEWFLSNN